MRQQGESPTKLAAWLWITPGTHSAGLIQLVKARTSVTDKTSHRPKRRVVFWALVGGTGLGLILLEAGLLKDIFGDPAMAHVFQGAVVLICASVVVGAIVRARLS